MVLYYPKPFPIMVFSDRIISVELLRWRDIRIKGNRSFPGVSFVRKKVADQQRLRNRPAHHDGHCGQIGRSAGDGSIRAQGSVANPEAARRAAARRGAPVLGYRRGSRRGAAQKKNAASKAASLGAMASSSPGDGELGLKREFGVVG